MNKIQESNIDRSKWGSGPWNEEPDRIEFEHAELPCLMLRQTSGHWCGYVAVPPGHLLYGKDYDDVNVDVHGGLTYSEQRKLSWGSSNKYKIVPQNISLEGLPANVWWFGFDCAHSMDRTPCLPPFYTFDASLDGIYRDAKYVELEIKRLAEQLKQLG
jgi:hypothetical protein